jgi:hypothetical protein
MTEDDIRRIIREELARAVPTMPLSPVYYPRHYPEPGQPYYPGGPWRATCGYGFAAATW